jgi:hypothetical protein
MGALVKLSAASRMKNYLNLATEPGISYRTTKTNMGVELFGNPPVTVVGGEKDGQALDGTSIRANQKVFIALGELCPQKYQVLVEVNPLLAAYGTAQCASIVEPGDNLELGIYLKADRQLDLPEGLWFVRLYLID